MVSDTEVDRRLIYEITSSLSGRLFAFHLRLLAFHLPFEHGGARRRACASAQEAACRGLAPIGSPTIAGWRHSRQPPSALDLPWSLRALHAHMRHRVMRATGWLGVHARTQQRLDFAGEVPLHPHTAEASGSTRRYGIVSPLCSVMCSDVL